MAPFPDFSCRYVILLVCSSVPPGGLPSCISSFTFCSLISFTCHHCPWGCSISAPATLNCAFVVTVRLRYLDIIKWILSILKHHSSRQRANRTSEKWSEFRTRSIRVCLSFGLVHFFILHTWSQLCAPPIEQGSLKWWRTVERIEDNQSELLTWVPRRKWCLPGGSGQEVTNETKITVAWTIDTDSSLNNTLGLNEKLATWSS